VLPQTTDESPGDDALGISVAEQATAVDDAVIDKFDAETQSPVPPPSNGVATAIESVRANDDSDPTQASADYLRAYSAYIVAQGQAAESRARAERDHAIAGDVEPARKAADKKADRVWIAQIVLLVIAAGLATAVIVLGIYAFVQQLRGVYSATNFQSITSVAAIILSLVAGGLNVSSRKSKG